MNHDTVLVKNPDVMARELAAPEGAVLLNLESGAYYGLNAVGLLVWELIDGHRTVRELVDGVRNAVADPPATLETDVTQFLDGALERELVRATS